MQLTAMPVHSTLPTSSVPALDPEAFDLLPKAFTPPASPSPQPCPGSGVSFLPDQRTAEGKLIKRFEDFRADPLFDECRREAGERLEELRLLSQQLGGRCDDRTDVLLSRVQRQLDLDGGRHFGVALPVVLGEGKRGLDEFCALMRQDTFDRGARRTALDNFVDELGACGPRAGLAMMRAPGLLRLAQGGLHAAFHQTVEHIVEQTLLQVWRDQDALRTHPLGHGMEPHGVQRLRTELGLPGGQDEDAYAGKGAVTPFMVANARSRLADQLDPAALAARLAADATSRLHSALRRDFAGDLDVIDPMQAEHGEIVQRQLDETNTRFGGIRFASIVAPRDADGDSCRITRDPTLIALDLMYRMSEMALCRPPVIRQIQRWMDDGGVVSLSHVRNQLFFIQHHGLGLPEPERSPVRIADLARLPEPGTAADFQTSAIGPWRERLAATVIAAASIDELMAFPREWVMDRSVATALLERLNPGERKAWLAARPLPAAAAAEIASISASLDEKQLKADAAARLRRLSAAFDKGDLASLDQAVQEMRTHDPAGLAKFLEKLLPGTEPLCAPATWAMARGESGKAELLLRTALELTQSQQLPEYRFEVLMTGALRPELFDEQASTQAWLTIASEARAAGLLGREKVREALAVKSTKGGSIELWSQDPGKAHRLTCWAELVGRAASQGLMDGHHAAEMLRGHPDRLPLPDALRNAQLPDAVAALLSGYVQAARHGGLPPGSLTALLRGDNLMPPYTFLATAVTADKIRDVKAFMSVAFVALQRKALPLEDYLQLVRDGAPGRPLLRTLCAKTPEMLGTYLDQLFIAAASGALPAKAVKKLLLARDVNRVPAIAGASVAHLARLHALVDDLRSEHRLSGWEAWRLKSAVSSAARRKR